ncbi:MAG TPA: electron transport complex subunit RsxG [Steroidobacteraceae bacterium]|nr:electron transport complex subunit RsxG [Steroidobacteraceae bacterium]
MPAKPVVTLAILAAVLTAVLALVASLTRERIAANEQAWIEQRLDALVAPDSHDNDLLADSITVTAPDLLGSAQPVMIYRARRGGAPVAAVIRPIAPDGYRGPIELLVAVAYDGRLIGVQVIRHEETPGLGDAFESRDVHWLDRFRGRSLTDPPPQRWTVRRDGGDFDAFTGATITPRAIVKAVRNALEYYQRNRQRIFEQPAGE